MDDLFTRFFFALYQFHKLHMGDLVPDITKLEGMTMAAIKHCSGEKEELTVSELTAKLKAKGPAVSRTLKTLEDKGYIERDVNKADRRNTYVKLTASGEQKHAETVIVTAVEKIAALIRRQDGREHECLLFIGGKL